MKKAIRITTTILTVICCLFPLSVCCFASISTAEINSVVISEPIGTPKIAIETVINDLVTKERVEERYGLYRSMKKPDRVTYDTSVYLLEYLVSPEYWNEVSTMDYDGLTAQIFCDYPTIIIPLFGDITDTSGKTTNRVIGHIKLCYKYLFEDGWKYCFHMFLYNLESEEFRNRKNVWYYEQIADYIAKSDKNIHQVFQISYPSALSEGMEIIAVIKTEDDVMIMDYSDSLKIDNGPFYDYVIYSVPEYREKRLQVEKEIYATVHGWDEVQFGGNAGSDHAETHDLSRIWIPVAVIILCCAGIAAFVIFALRRRRLSK